MNIDDVKNGRACSVPFMTSHRRKCNGGSLTVASVRRQQKMHPDETLNGGDDTEAGISVTATSHAARTADYESSSRTDRFIVCPLGVAAIGFVRVLIRRRRATDACRRPDAADASRGRDGWTERTRKRPSGSRYSIGSCGDSSRGNERTPRVAD